MNFTGSILNGLKFDASRSFIILFGSLPLLLTHGILNILQEKGYGLIIFYSLILSYFLFYRKGLQLFNSFKKISQNADSVSEFKLQYVNYMESENYKKFRKNIYFLLGCSTTAFAFIVLSIFS